MYYCVALLSGVLLYQYITIKKERYLECSNTNVIKVSIHCAFIIFLVIEFIVFWSLFWGYFHFRITEIWPPIGIVKCDAYRLPLINTCVLLRSAISLTVYHDILIGRQSKRLIYVVITVRLGLIFMYTQYDEYKYHLMYRISDGVFGRVFYSLTGFHGSHVIIGILILIATLNLDKCAMFNNHMGVTASIWYWHFVDVIWVFLFLFVYIY